MLSVAPGPLLRALVSHDWLRGIMLSQLEIVLTPYEA